jgi:hypothetical protein
LSWFIHAPSVSIRDQSRAAEQLCDSRNEETNRRSLDKILDPNRCTVAQARDVSNKHAAESADRHPPAPGHARQPRLDLAHCIVLIRSSDPRHEIGGGTHRKDRRRPENTDAGNIGADEIDRSRQRGATDPQPQHCIPRARPDRYLSTTGGWEQLEHAPSRERIADRSLNREREVKQRGAVEHEVSVSGSRRMRPPLDQRCGWLLRAVLDLPHVASADPDPNRELDLRQPRPHTFTS